MFKLNNLFRRKQIVHKNNYSIMVSINRMLDRCSMHVFKLFNMEIMSEDLTFIVYAVWGTKNGAITSGIQKEIYETIEPEVQAAYSALELSKEKEPQRDAILSLIRGIVVYKLLFMAEHLKNKTRQPEVTFSEDTMDILCHIKEIGNA